MTGWRFQKTILICVISFGVIIGEIEGQDPCDTYTEDYDCALASQSRVHPFQVTESDCDRDLVATTVKLLEAGDLEIELSDNDEAVLMIGTTGTGKSTLTYFLAGNNSLLISYKVSTGRYNIKDCNGKIGGSNSTIVSSTIFPDLVVEPLSNTAFYDNPGFEDTRSPCIEIATAYFMKKVASHVKRVKFVIVINYSSVAIGESRTEFTRMLSSVMSFIPNVSKFSPAFSMMATKLKIGEGETEEDYANDAVTFMKNSQPYLGESFQDEELQKANAIVDAIAAREKVSVFRMPTACGPLSEMENMQKNKQIMSDIIQNNSNFVESTPTDFGTTISGDAKVKVLELAAKLSQDTIQFLQKFGQQLMLHLDSQFNCESIDDCSDIMMSLTVMSSNPDFIEGYENESVWTNLTYTDLIGRVTNALFLPPNFEIPIEILEGLEKNGRYLDFLNGLANFELIISHWLQPMKDFRRKIVDEINNSFYAKFQLDLFNSLDLLSWDLMNGTLFKLNELDTIQEKQTRLQTYAAILGPLKEEIESEFDGGINLSIFLNKTVHSFKSLEIELPATSISKILDQIPFLDTIDLLTHSTTIGPEPTDWLQPLSHAYGLLQSERGWNNFVTLLFDDLTSMSVQGDNEFELKKWWRDHGDLELDDGKSFENFWNAFQNLSTLQSTDYQSMKNVLDTDYTDSKLGLLNLLLRTTLDPFECQLSGDGVSIFKGHFLSLQEVLNSSTSCIQKGKTRTLILAAHHSIYIDTDLMTSTINPVENVDVLIISPKWSTKFAKTLNLNGAASLIHPPIQGQGQGMGKPGNVGGKAGNFVGIGQHFSGLLPTVSVDGGQGGDGQDGQHGLDGTNGGVRAIATYNDQGYTILTYCQNFGGIDFYQWPYTCQNPFTIYCQESSWGAGVWYDVVGFDGTPGGPGGHGGKRALGGTGGSTFLAQIEGHSKQNRHEVKGISGSPGSDGRGGVGGLGGQMGATNHFTVFTITPVLSICGLGSQEYRPVDVKQPDGVPGVTGGNPEIPASPLPQTFDPDFFAPYIRQFKMEAGGAVQSNQFVEPVLMDFVAKLEENGIP